MTPSPLDIEHATLRAWPAREMEDYTGWRLCAASGVTGRVNACWPIEWRGGDIDAAIDAVEAWYGARNLAPRFKLTDGAYAPIDLTAHLERRGYAPTMRTLVMIASLASEPAHYEAVTRASDMPPSFDRALTESTADADDLEERRAIAARMPRPRVFATREQEDMRALAVGASACAGKLAGVFLMRTVPEARRQGHAQHILRALLDWAWAQEATHAFLQVDADNAPAIALYEREGFVTLTTYCFWRRPLSA
ncbi:MAG: GNAT family N-acetyltransferase [Hyphomonadaceae bacterium]|nr:GNAT family N-acetyltransferase [Hyphomonadaceae bacterium]